MSNKEIKTFAKNKVNGHFWEILVPLLVADLLTGLTVGQKIVQTENGVKVEGGYSLGLFFAFVGVGLAFYLVNFITDKEYKFSDIFAFINDYVRIFVTTLLEALFIILYTIMLIVPGIIKCFGYSLVNYILADEKYKDLKYKEVLDLSEKMMVGHKMDLFKLMLSYIGWFLLGIITLGIAIIYILPQYHVSIAKFLYDVKSKYEAENK